MGIGKRACGLARSFFASASLGVIALSSGAFANSNVIHNSYDGVTNDLLTAGLGKTGLGGAFPVAFVDPANPTTDELRKFAIYNNYRALIDPTAAGGFGTLYGPNVLPDGTVTTGEGKIAGDEYITFQNEPHKNVTLMVQVPSTFNPSKGCIVTAPSSGSRGIYGAIATAGEWGLKHGCAVAYTDKGSGIGAHDLQNDKVNLIQGQQVRASQADNDAIFKARLSSSQLSVFKTTTPNRFAFKHAHSQQNPEMDWGRNVLASIQFAFEILDEKYGHGRVAKSNTMVIASSVSNGGGASLLAAEQDGDGLIDGVAVGEPNVNPEYNAGFTIQQGSGTPLLKHSRPLIDYITFVNVYQRCANGVNASAPLNLFFAASPAACGSLHQKGLLQSANATDQANEAQKIINDFGILPEQNIVQPGYWASAVSRSISVTYANAYGRFGVEDNLCNFSFAAVDTSNSPAPAPTASEAQLFGSSNGIPPSGIIKLINNGAPGGIAKEDSVSTADQNLDGALCLRSLATGKDAVSGNPFSVTDPRRDLAGRIYEGVNDIRANGRLHGLPTVMVTGRNDGILPPNFASRAYYGLNKSLESRSPTYYYEITNAHHLDTLNQFVAYGSLFVPLHRYYIQALDLMYDHLKNHTPLPPSQVVHTTPRGSSSITLANVPPILQTPAAADVITFTPGNLHIPD